MDQMENIFTANIKSVLEKYFGNNANDIFDKSQLIQYLNEKTRSANIRIQNLVRVLQIFMLFML
jgi:hypothetical protein